MSSSDEPVGEFDLHAFVDDQLTPQRRAAVQAYLADNPRDTARVAAWREQKRLLHALYDPVLNEPLPARLANGAATPPSRRLPGWFAHAATAVLYVSLGLAAGTLLNKPAPTPAGSGDLRASLQQQAALAHAVYTPEVLHPVEVTADQQAHLVKWLSKRLGHEIVAPDLSDQGMHLVGGRLLPGESGPAAQFMYENAAGTRLTLYVRTDTGESHDSAFQFSRRDGISVFYWIDGQLGYALSGELDREPLLRMATRVYTQINQ